jgi:hypothetical protein
LIACSTSAPPLDALEIEDDPVGLHLFDVEDIVDQPDQPLAVRLRDREQALGRFVQLSGGAADQQPERAGDRRQRRAQLVADRRHEFVLQALQPLPLADVDDDAENEQPLAGLDRIEPDIDRELGAVPAQPKQIATRTGATGFRMVGVGVAVAHVLAAQARRHQNVDALAD